MIAPLHGGDVVGYRLRHGRNPIDFSASLNPLGMPASVRDAAMKAVDDSVAYPDPFCRALRVELARRRDLPAENLFLGAGAADVVYRLVRAARPRTALVVSPTFAEYEQALLSVACRIRRHALTPEDGFELGADILGAITSSLDMLFLCQPNNPTGKLIDPALLAAVVERCGECGVLAMVDECFLPFVDDPERHSLIGRLERFPRLFILDSFTKLYGMAGIRLGYGISADAGLVRALSPAGPPWAVSTVAQAAGLAALAETEYVRESLRVLAREKPRLVGWLNRSGCRVFGSDANFVFFSTPVTDLDWRLEREGILIRNCRNFHGLEPGYFRVAVRMPDDNDALLRAMDAVMNGDA